VQYQNGKEMAIVMISTMMQLATGMVGTAATITDLIMT
jgi:hypothetical protein